MSPPHLSDPVPRPAPSTDLFDREREDWRHDPRSPLTPGLPSSISGALPLKSIKLSGDFFSTGLPFARKVWSRSIRKRSLNSWAALRSENRNVSDICGSLNGYWTMFGKSNPHRPIPLVSLLRMAKQHGAMHVTTSRRVFSTTPNVPRSLLTCFRPCLPYPWRSAGGSGAIAR